MCLVSSELHVSSDGISRENGRRWDMSLLVDMVLYGGIGFLLQIQSKEKPWSLWWLVTGLALEGVLWTNVVASRKLATGDKKR